MVTNGGDDQQDTGRDAHAVLHAELRRVVQGLLDQGVPSEEVSRLLDERIAALRAEIDRQSGSARATAPEDLTDDVDDAG